MCKKKEKELGKSREVLFCKQKKTNGSIKRRLDDMQDVRIVELHTECAMHRSHSAGAPGAYLAANDDHCGGWTTHTNDSPCMSRRRLQDESVRLSTISAFFFSSVRFAHRVVVH